MDIFESAYYSSVLENNKDPISNMAKYYSANNLHTIFRGVYIIVSFPYKNGPMCAAAFEHINDTAAQTKSKNFFSTHKMQNAQISLYPMFQIIL